MTDKIKQTYAKLSTKAKLGIMASIIMLALASSIAAFAADSDIVVKWTDNSYGDSSFAVYNPVIRCYITDSADYINPDTLVAKLDGQIVPATFDTSDTYPEVGPSKAGTIRVQAPRLADGPHPVEISIADNSGNQLNYTWNFTINLKPKFSAINPPKFSGVPGGASSISMVITDNGTIDWPNLYFRINGIMQTPEINKETGLVIFRGPFPKGQTDVYVNAKDLKGNFEYEGYWFYNDIGDPKFQPIKYKQYTDFNNGLSITDGILNFEGNVTDYVNVPVTSLTATLDGAPLSLAVNPNGNNPGDTLALTHYKYSGVVKDGNHTLVINVRDACGNSNSLTRTFVVKSPPVISNWSPVQYGVQNLSQIISADVVDPNGTIVPQSVILTVDGVKVNHNYVSTTNKVTYQTGQLADESYHTVSLSATDDAGMTTTKTWKFFTDSKNLPDMADSNISNCNTCHPGFTTLESHALNYAGEHWDRSANCGVCHNYITQEPSSQQCVECHEGEEPGPHGSSPGVSYNAVNYDKTIPLRVQTNREMFDCVICHQPGAGTLSAAGIRLNNHDIPELHKYSEEDALCNQCHAKSLTKEHARPGRVDKNGSAITCNTCHRSTSPLVVNAIANSRKDCNACHIVADHSGKSHMGRSWNCMSELPSEYFDC